MKARTMIMGGVLGVGTLLAFTTYLQAFSVGDLTVRSRRGMPFLAEVSLTLNPQERGQGVVVSLGNHEEYRAEGMSRPEVVEHLDVSWIPGARDVVLIASTKPIREAVFDLVLSVRSGQVTIVRTYQVDLPAPLSPPSSTETRASAPPPKVRPAVTAAATPTKPSSSSHAATPTKPSSSSHAMASPSWVQQLPNRYGPVAQGTTLFAVVNGLGVPTEVIWQTLVRIWEANKEQFSGGNMHGLHSGGYLTIPSSLANDIQTLRQAEAHRIVVEQWEVWQEIRRAIDGRQQLVPTDSQVAPGYREAVRLTKASAAVSSSEPEALAPVVVTSDIQTPAASSTVVLPADQMTAGASVAEMQSVIQGLERLLAQRLPQTQDAGETMAFVRSTELQTALQGLEDRLAHKLQESLRKITVTQQAAPLSQRSSMQNQTALEQLFPPGSMLYVLVLENALLLLMASVILWRWFRSRA